MEIQPAANFDAKAREAIADAVTAIHAARAPDLYRRYGERGRRHAHADALFHLSFIADALAVNRPELFHDYIRWTVGMLEARHVGRQELLDHLAIIAEVITDRLSDSIATEATTVIQAAMSSIPAVVVAAASFLDGDYAAAPLAHSYLELMLEHRRDDALAAIHAAAAAGLPIEDIHLDVFQRCQREIGRLWQFNHISVAEEHYCSAVTQLAMAQLYPRVRDMALRRPNGRTIMAACVGGELHEIGLRVVSDIFEIAGWNSVYFGASLPPEAMAAAARDHRPDLVALSVTMTFNLGQVAEIIARIRDAVGDSVPIMVGGYPFSIAPDLWRQLGADASGADAREALAAAAAQPPRNAGR